ncbi:MAG: DUF4124 domain-containing protein [Myxococcales bacterium]
MKRPLALLVAILCLAAGSAHAEVFRWVDEKGDVHYTDNADDIPASKRKSAVKTEGGTLGYVKTETPRSPAKAPNRADGEASNAAAAAEAAREAEDAKERAAEEEEARREKEWRGRFREIHQRIDRLQRMIDADKKALADPTNSGIPMMSPNANGVILPNPEFEAIRRRIPEEEAQLRDAKEDLADLEREASRNSVPQNWRK